ncbi:PAS domain S-box protein [filamentous cyanobacterium LEGE 11480]|uniref:Circadian input-output histidine kinase CikA n=1 Tax=Romeriopsis navalis LEGE 11480 TaxID=2777977 RepID=A0A928Z4Q7_9CYAN|nr:PAS domain S-box protein [Romeriopsis navalis]MBE9032881.1 PAS domain S-box protein [Romeriopsis navalis LEGE 11480]
MSNPKTAFTAVEWDAAIIQDLVMVSPELPLVAALTQMPTIQAVANSPPSTDCLVVQENHQIVGLLTSQDIIRLVSQDRRSFEHLRLREVMVAPVITLCKAALTDLTSVTELFQQHPMTHLPIVDEQNGCVGLVTPDSLNQASLMHQLQRSQRQQDVIADITLRVLQHTGVEEIAKAIVQEVRALMVADRVLVYQFDADMNGTIVAESVLESWTACLNIQITDTCFQLNQGGMYLDGYVSQVTDILTADLTTCHRQLLEQFQVRANLVVPILLPVTGSSDRAGPSLWGLLIVHQCSGPRTWNRYDIQLLQQLSAQLAIALQQVTAYQQLQDELQARQQAEWGQHAIEARYRSIYEQAAVGFANGSLKGAVLDVNPRFCEMLGYSRAELLTKSVRELSHDDEHRPMLQQMQMLLNDEIPYFFQEKRYRRKDGSWFWSNTGISLVRDNTGKPQQTLAVIRDITDRKQAEMQLQKLISGTAATTGQDFFPALVSHIAAALNVTYALVTELDGDRLFSLAFWGHGALQPQLVYPLAGTPCEAVSQKWDFHCEKMVQQAFPADRDLVDLQAESYLGTALRDEHDQVIGILSVMHIGPIPDPQRAAEILRVFAARASAELSRKQASLALEQLNQALEIKVQARTVKLQEREQFLQTVLDAFPLAIFWKDRNSVYLGCNSYFLKDAGLTSIQDVVGKTDFDLPWGQTEAELYRADDHAVMESATPKLGIIESQLQGTGQRIWLETNKIPLYDVHSNIIGVMGTYQDITARQQAEESLRELSVRLDLAVGSADIGIWDWDIVHDQMFWDQRMHELYGFVSADWLDGFTTIYAAWLHQLHPDDRAAADLISRQALNGECDYDTEFRIMHPGGSVRFIKATAVVQRDSEGKPQRMVGINYDITEHQQAAVQLKQINEELIRATRLKDEFLANMSHELRTPLNAILGLAESLQEGIFGTLNESQLKGVQTIGNSGEHLLELINDILDLAKIEAGQIELDCSQVALGPLCQASLVFVKQQAFRKGIQLESHFPHQSWHLWVDARRIRQVLINLLTNAVKFTPEDGRVTLAVSIESPSRDDCRVDTTAFSGEVPHLSAQRLRIMVTDTGIGISPAQVNKLFQPFIQVDSALNRKYEGTGLGLALVKRIVELHGGSVSVTSEVGVGSCFIVDLPCVIEPISTRKSDPVDVTDRQNRELTHPLRPTAGALILLAEDNPSNVETLVGYLEAKGYRLLIANNGKDVITLVQTESPDVVLMDIQMPEIDGLEAIRRIRRMAKGKDLPIIALTALAMHGDRERCLAAGANEYLSKPVKLKQLSVLIRQFVGA